MFMKTESLYILPYIFQLVSTFQGELSTAPCWCHAYTTRQHVASVCVQADIGVAAFSRYPTVCAPAGIDAIKTSNRIISVHHRVIHVKAEQTVLRRNADREHPREERQHTWNGAYSGTCSPPSSINHAEYFIHVFLRICRVSRTEPMRISGLLRLATYDDLRIFAIIHTLSQIMQKNRCLFLSNQSRRRSSHGWTEQTSPVGTRPTITLASYIGSK